MEIFSFRQQQPLGDSPTLANGQTIAYGNIFLFKQSPLERLIPLSLGQTKI